MQRFDIIELPKQNGVAKMEKIFKEMMENYCQMYLNSEEGQKAMLLSMAGVLNNRNIEVADRIVDCFANCKWQLRDIKYISERIKETIDTCHFMTAEKYEVLCNAIMEVSRILDVYQANPIVNATLEKRIDKIYQDLTILGVERRRISKEEFLELADIDEEPQKVNDNLYSPPERNDESRLVKYGYSVSQNSRLSNAERQDLLRRIIESKEVSKGYIISYLKHMIAINGKKESNYIALQKWENDLEYVLKL